jgi:ketosteroid isomerase-like protein
VGQVHQTADPEVVIFEFSYVGSANGRPFTVPCIFVTRVRDGVIVESRDYADHVGMARAFGRLDQLAAALAAGPR